MELIKITFNYCKELFYKIIGNFKNPEIIPPTPTTNNIESLISNLNNLIFFKCNEDFDRYLFFGFISLFSLFLIMLIYSYLTQELKVKNF